MSRLLACVPLALIVAFFTPTASAQTTLRVHGSTSAIKLMQAKQSELEAACGAKLELIPNSSGRGLRDLGENRTDIAIVAGTLEANAAAVNAEKPGTIDPKSCVTQSLIAYRLHPIIHPSNPVSSLTRAQLKDILTGKAANWKSLGGPDLPIIVIIAPPIDGGRQIEQAELLGDEKFLPTARVVNNAPDVCKIVEQLPGAFSIASTWNRTGNIKSVTTDRYLLSPQIAVTLGKPNDTATKFLDATIKLLADKSESAQ